MKASEYNCCQSRDLHLRLGLIEIAWIREHVCSLSRKGTTFVQKIVYIKCHVFFPCFDKEKMLFSFVKGCDWEVELGKIWAH